MQFLINKVILFQMQLSSKIKHPKHGHEPKYINKAIRERYKILKSIKNFYLNILLLYLK